MSCIDTGSARGHDTIESLNGNTMTETMPWNAHPKFDGVFLRHLVTGNDSGGRISLHHVRIYPGCSIGDHAHSGQVEIHDVLDGEGVCRLEEREIRYVPGVVGIMPADRVHRIDAGERGMLLLATFCPPLV
jgi:quercetin dioxygenase-like cupin family protein